MTKDELIKRANKYTRRGATIEIGRDTIVDMIDIMDGLVQALDAQIKACDVPKIEGLGEALEVDNEQNPQYLMLAVTEFKNKYKCMPVVKFKEAARAFHKITGGDDDN